MIGVVNQATGKSNGGAGPGTGETRTLQSTAGGLQASFVVRFASSVTVGCGTPLPFACRLGIFRPSALAPQNPHTAAGLSTWQPPESSRPALSRCSEAEFLDDVWRFLTAKRGKDIDRASFPDAILNGAQLDLFALYKETVTRGGYKCAPFGKP